MLIFIRRPENVSLQKVRGVGVYDTNLRSILVQASVESVAQALISIKDVNVWKSNVYGREIELARNSALIFQLKGHPWSVVYVPYFPAKEIDPTKLSIQEIEKIMHSPLELPFDLLELDALKISELLKTSVIFYSVSDTLGLTEYQIYKNGLLEEKFSSQEGSLIEFQSKYRQVEAKSIKNVYKFVDESIREQDAFVPWLDVRESLDIGKRVLLQIDGLVSDDVERMDYVIQK